MNEKRVLLVSCSVILLCMTIIVGMTWALFTDTTPVKHHLQAGTLDITLERTSLVTMSLDDTTGYLKGTENHDIVDFSNPTDRNVFDIDDDTLIVPCCEYTATMRVTNNSDVAFAYWLEIKLNTTGLDTEQIEALKLDEQLRITVTTTATSSKYLNEGLMVGDQTQPIGTLEKNGLQLFTVSVEVVDDTIVNNLAKGQSLDFDLVVHAVQVTDAPATTP